MASGSAMDRALLWGLWVFSIDGVTREVAGTSFGPENHLRAPKRCKHPVGVAMSNQSVPHLRMSSHMHGLGLARDDSVSSSADEIALQLNGGEAGGTIR